MTAEKKAIAMRDRITEQFMQHQFDEGIRFLEAQGTNFPEHVRLECLGNLHFYRKELQEAVRSYESAIKAVPDYPIARYQYLVGTQEEREGKFVDAFKRYQMAIEIEPEFVDPYVELGGLLVKVGDFEGAAQCYRDAVRLDPSDLANHHNLKSVLSRLAEADPSRYAQELALANTAYENAARDAKPKSLSEHQW